MKAALLFLTFWFTAHLNALEIAKDQSIGLLLPSGWQLSFSADGSGSIITFEPKQVFSISPKRTFDYDTLRSAINRALAGEYKSSKIMLVLMDSDDSGGMDAAPDIPEIQDAVARAQDYYTQKPILDFADVLRNKPIQKK